MKKIVLSIVAILLVISMAYTTYAAGGSTSASEIEGMLQNEMGNIDKNGTAEDIPEGENRNTALNTNTNTNTNTSNVKVNENLPEKTPYTGIGDYSGLIFVAVFGISAIYAYKKVKEYNA